MDISTTSDIVIPPPAEKPRMRWGRAWRAFRDLVANADDTAKAQDVFMAIGARDFERNFQRFAADPAGRRLLGTSRALADVLADRHSLARLPAASLGRNYLEYLDANNFEPLALLELQRDCEDRWVKEGLMKSRDPLRRRFGERFVLIHDLSHVLTDYGTDDLGEAALLAFAQSQQRGRANSLLTFGASFEIYRRLGRRWVSYVYNAWRRGRRARWLVTMPWEELLSLPLATVRELASVETADISHPQGIWRS